MSLPTHYKYYFDAMRDSSTGLQLPPSSDWRVKLTTNDCGIEFVGYTLIANVVPERYIQFDETNAAAVVAAGAVGGDEVTAGAISL